MIPNDGARTLPKQSILKWEPKVGLEQGLKLTLAYFKEVFRKK